MITRCDKNDFRDAVDEFIAMKSEDKNFTLFWTYMTMGQMLLCYTRADRTDNWPLHANSFTRMLGAFERYDKCFLDNPSAFTVIHKDHLDLLYSMNSVSTSAF